MQFKENKGCDSSFLQEDHQSVMVDRILLIA